MSTTKYPVDTQKDSQTLDMQGNKMGKQGRLGRTMQDRQAGRQEIDEVGQALRQAGEIPGRPGKV